MLGDMKIKQLFPILIISLLTLTQPFAETVYKKVNPDGSVEFTDQEVKGSEAITVHDPITYTAPKLPAPTLPVKKLSPQSEYTLTVKSPAQESTINESTDVVVSISLSPALKEGYKIKYQLDGKSILSQETSVTFTNVSRGTKQLHVNIVNSAGETISPVVTSTFYMKRFFKKPVAKPPAKPKTP